MQLHAATKSILFSAKEIDTILMTLQEKNESKATLQGITITLLYYGLLRATKIVMEDESVESRSA